MSDKRGVSIWESIYYVCFSALATILVMVVVICAVGVVIPSLPISSGHALSRMIGIASLPLLVTGGVAVMIDIVLRWPKEQP